MKKFLKNKTFFYSLVLLFFHYLFMLLHTYRRDQQIVRTEKSDENYGFFEPEQVRSASHFHLNDLFPIYAVSLSFLVILFFVILFLALKWKAMFVATVIYYLLSYLAILGSYRGTYNELNELGPFIISYICGIVCGVTGIVAELLRYFLTRKNKE